MISLLSILLSVTVFFMPLKWAIPIIVFSVVLQWGRVLAVNVIKDPKDTYNMVLIDSSPGISIKSLIPGLIKFTLKLLVFKDLMLSFNLLFILSKIPMGSTERYLASLAVATIGLFFIMKNKYWENRGHVSFETGRVAEEMRDGENVVMLSVNGGNTYAKVPKGTSKLNVGDLIEVALV